MSIFDSLVFVDCEAWGNCPATGELTEFGAVHYTTRKTFHGILVKTQPDPHNPAIPIPTTPVTQQVRLKIFTEFDQWLTGLQQRRYIFISDNPAFDWQWINDGFWRTLNRNPFGFSARRIGDFYAGLMKDFGAASKWKKLRVTKHDHNPVNDAMGNVEAFARMMKGER